jgi:uncharacterized NAD(P)/FAD-binding protein YdhS
MRGRGQLLELFRRWDQRTEPIPLAELVSAVEGLDLGRDDLAGVFGFDEGCYRRTVIHARPHYQVLVLCWRSGQRSPIHDHSGSSCVVRVIEGHASETRFGPTPSGRLIPIGTHEHSDGAVAASSGAEIHQMGNFAGSGQDLITLHIYSPPPASWRFYSVSETTLADHDRLIGRPARTVRVELGHSHPVPPMGSRTRGGSPCRHLIEPGVGAVIAIIGGGFSGTMVAVHLARLAGPSPLRIRLIEKGPRPARGLAYATRCDGHLLNVPAGLMSALADEPAHFLDWLRARDPGAQAGTFAPRRVYGDYLEELLRATASDAAVPIELEHDEVVALDIESDEAGRLRLRTAGGRLIVADRVVLAIGNQPPQDPPGLPRLRAVRRYATDPWGPSLLDGLGADEPIGLIGSGLTAVDVIVEAHSRGHRGVIHAISRHGLLPRRHRPAPPRPHFPLGGEGTSARGLLRSVRVEAARCQAEGGDWRSVVDGIRPVAQALWRSLRSEERRRFVRHLAPHWDVHRHRVAPEIDDLLQARLAGDRLVVIAGRVLALDECDGRVVLTFQRRGQSEPERLALGRVINCTGPARDIRLSRSTLLRSLLADGIARPGPLALGLDVDDSGALIRPDGRIHDRLFAVGPLLKERLWETTAVRELRIQAAELARRLLGAA